MARIPAELRVPLLVAVLSACVYVPFAGSFGLLDPWETHYGEVARSMVESGDWISPWWGSTWPEGEPCATNGDCGAEEVCQTIRGEFLQRPATCRPKKIKREGAYFFSKPALIMWMMATGMAALGVGPWGMRALFLLVGIHAIFVLTWAVRRFLGDRVAALAGLVVATSPFWAMLSRQAVTDGPFVALMAAGTAHLCVALFDDRARLDEPAPRAFRLLAVAVVVLVLPQALLVGLRLGVSFPFLRWRILAGPFHGAAWAACALGFLLWARRRATAGNVHAWTFYLLVGLATLGKGILGFALPGAVILLYLVLTREWRLLRRAELLRGPLVFAAVCFPWYGAMLARHLHGFYERFFLHDHFKRLATGVHQIDTGGFEHFLFWLGLGMFPWSAFLPAALGRAVAGPRPEGEGARRFQLFCGLWFLLAFTLFTVSHTKFHHYIFPAVPPAAVLVALLLDDLDRARGRVVVLLVAGSLCLYALVASALVADPQRIINLITYMYDRNWPPELDYRRFLTVVAWIGAAPLVLWLARELWPRLSRSRLASLPVATFTAFTVFFATWCVDRYLPGISPTWSQQGLFDAYYAGCTPEEPPVTLLSGRRVCEETLVAYKMNWRGETFHSDNTVIPLPDDATLEYFLTTEAGKRTFYALVEYSRLEGQLKGKLSQERRRAVRKVHEDNAKFVLVRVPAGEG